MTRISTTMLLATAIMLWLAPVASAGSTCTYVGRNLVCRDDNGGNVGCTWVGNTWKCWDR